MPKIPRPEKKCCTCKNVKPASDFYKNKSTDAGLSHQCIDCCKEYQERTKERSYYVRKLIDFNLSKDKIEELKLSQDFKCRGCGITEEKLGARLSIDHDHKCCPGKNKSCGKCIRGLLCSPCNVALGILGDDYDTLLSLAEYIKEWQNVKNS